MSLPPRSVLDDAPAMPLGEIQIAERIGLALVAGVIVAVLYAVTLGRRKRDSAAMPLTLVLLSVLVCMVVLIVNGSVALAFTLGGTLAIVRFRTVVDDTRDTAFVIAAVVAGMGMGTGAFMAVLIGLPVVALTVFAAFSTRTAKAAPTQRVVVRIANDRDPDELTRAAFESCGLQPTLIAIETAKQGTAIEAIYGVKNLNNAAMLKVIAALRGVEGVQGVEVKPI